VVVEDVVQEPRRGLRRSREARPGYARAVGESALYERAQVDRSQAAASIVLEGLLAARVDPFDRHAVVLGGGVPLHRVPEDEARLVALPRRLYQLVPDLFRPDRL